MKKVITHLIPLLIVPVIVGCKGSTTSVSSSDTSSSHVEPPASLNECILNTEDYNIYFGGDEAKTYMEVNTPDTYLYGPAGYGYTVLDNDPGYMHFFQTYRAGAKYYTQMYGRVGSDTDYKTLRSKANSFISLIYETQDYYVQLDDWTYVYLGNKLGSIYKQFFQLNSFNFCNYYEIGIGKDGRINSFRAGELYEGDDEVFYTVNSKIEKPGDSTLAFFDDWQKDGGEVVERIFDYKSFYVNGRNYAPCYDSGDVDAIVTSIDFDGSFHIANSHETNGPIGMRVTPKEEVSVEIGDKVHVSGDIVMDTSGKYFMSPRFVDADVEVIDKNHSVPCFSEESIVDSYVPGIYVGDRFLTSPIYSASLYNGYGYLGDVPEYANETGDTLVNIYYPAFIFNQTGKTFYSTLHFPKEMGKENIEQILANIRKLGDYAVNKSTCRLAYIQNITIFYGANGSVELYALPNTIVSHRLSFVETIEQDFGMQNFPNPTFKPTASGFFHFGESAQWYLEEQYYESTIDDPLSGVFYFSNSASRAEIDAYMKQLVDYGATLADIIMFYYSNDVVHYIYTMPNNIVIDIMFDDDFGVSRRIQVYVYRSETIYRTPSVGQKIEAANGFFKDEDFIRLPGTYDCNYRFFQVTSYAGNTFSRENPLTIAVMDLTENRYDELREAYRNAGWKVYRNEDGKAFSYITRGLTRNVYYKEGENGKKIFIDFGLYTTDDYTFTDHKKFTYRVEMAIYEADAPIKTQYTKNLDCIGTDASLSDGVGSFKWTLKDCYKAEVYRKDTEIYDIEFGYSFTTNAFLYLDGNTSTLDELLEYVKETFIENGYEFLYTTAKGFTFGYPKKEGNGYTSFLHCLKDDARGFVRVIAGLGGIDL